MLQRSSTVVNSAPRSSLIFDVRRPSGPFRHVCAPLRASAEDSDLITGLVGKIFGQSALDDRNPFGIKRMDWSQASAGVLVCWCAGVLVCPGTHGDAMRHAGPCMHPDESMWWGGPCRSRT
jgi:hypothetical protein